MPQDLKNKVVLITGASGQVGSVLAKSFVKQGSLVVITTTQKKSARILAEKLSQHSENAVVKGFELDISQQTSINDFVQNLREQKIEPEILIHCARSQKPLIEKQGAKTWNNWVDEYNVDVVGPYFLCLALAETIGKAKDGSIIFVSSIYGKVAVNPTIYEDKTWAVPPHYSCAKSAQIHLAKELAIRFAPKVRVNAICYGGVKGRMDPTFYERYKNLCPQNRMLEKKDIPGPALFLASSESSGMTGGVLTADGGWSTW